MTQNWLKTYAPKIAYHLLHLDKKSKHSWIKTIVTEYQQKKQSLLKIQQKKVKKMDNKVVDVINNAKVQNVTACSR